MSISAIGRTPLDHWHGAHGGRLVERDGWRIVESYRSDERGSNNIADVSACAKLELLGPGVSVLACAAFGSTLPEMGSVQRLGAGQGGWVCRFGPKHLVLIGDRPGIKNLPQITPADGLVINDITSSYAGIALVGPDIGKILSQLTAFDIGPKSFPAGSCAATGLAGVRALLIRLPPTSVDAIHIYVDWDLNNDSGSQPHVELLRGYCLSPSRASRYANKCLNR